MSQKNLFKYFAVAIAVALVSAQVSAAGFQLNEYSSSGLGRAFSGEGAVADNATSGSRNPATMTMFDRLTFSGGVTYINPDIDITGRSTRAPTYNDASAKNIAPHAWVPNMHFIMPLNDQWAVGASATTNFSLATEFNDSYTAGALGGKTDLLTSNLNLSAAYRLNQHFSFGLGINAVYADATIVRHLGEASASVPTTRPSTEIARLEGKEWGYGWNAGILYEVDKNNRFGLTYRSKVDIDFKGDYSNQLPTFVTGGSTVRPFQGS